MTIKELQAKMAAAKAAAEAIVKAADEDSDGVLSEDQKKEFDGHITDFESAKSSYDAKIKLESVDTAFKTPTVPPVTQHPSVQPGAPDDSLNKTPLVTSIPYRGKIKSFQGPNALKEAYSVGKWIQAVIYDNKDAAGWCHEQGLNTTAVMNLGDNTAGAILAPDILEAAIINLREERGIFRQEAFNFPMTGDHHTVPRRTGGITVQAVGENLTSDITASDPSYDEVGLTAKTWAGLGKYSRSLGEDAIVSIADIFVDEFSYGFADKEDTTGFNGTGASTFHGIHGATVKVDDGNHTASVYDALSGNTAFSTLDLADFEGCAGSLKQTAVANAKWYISRQGFYASMQRLMDAAGGNTVDTLANASSEGGGRPLQFLGFPVVISQVLNSTLTAQASTVVALFGDLRQGATLGDRRGLGFQVLNELFAARLQIGVLGWSRWDINVHELGDNTDAGSIVALKTAAS